MSHRPRSIPQVRSPDVLESASPHAHASPMHSGGDDDGRHVLVRWEVPIRSLGSEPLRAWARAALAGVPLRTPACELRLHVRGAQAWLSLHAGHAERALLAAASVTWVHDPSLDLHHVQCRWPQHGVRCDLTMRGRDGHVIFARHDAWRTLGVPGGRYDRIDAQ